MLDDVKSKFRKPINGSEFDDQMILKEQCINKIKVKIENIINDERIIVRVIRLDKTLKEINNKVKFEISVNHKIFKNKTNQLCLILEDVLASD